MHAFLSTDLRRHSNPRCRIGERLAADAGKGRGLAGDFTAVSIWFGQCTFGFRDALESATNGPPSWRKACSLVETAAAGERCLVDAPKIPTEIRCLTEAFVFGSLELVTSKTLRPLCRARIHGPCRLQWGG